MVLTITVKRTGFASILASQEGDTNWLPAESIILRYQVMSKEVLVKVDDQFRSPTQNNPEFTYSINGVIGNDNSQDFNISIIAPVPDGNLSSPTPVGTYPITASGGLSDNYLFAYQPGNLVVSSSNNKSFLIKI